MNRLTEKINNESFVKRKNESRSVCYGCESISYCITKCNLYEAIEKLTEYEDLEKQGLLIKLPCKVGSTVYRILYDRNIENSKVESFEFSEEGIFVRVSYESPMAYITSSYPIEDLYFTREEAEKALEDK